MTHSRSDFALMGRAIEQRYNRCKLWWRTHLELTASFVGANVTESSSVAVLGAGRMLDLNLGALLEKCDTVHLFDADPGALSRWRSASGGEFGRRVVGHLVDLTESMNPWSKGLAAAIRTGRLEGFLRGCSAPTPTWALEPFDGYISLNLLGQIPLYWRDRVLAATGSLTEVEWAALEKAMEQLQVAHLRGLVLRPEAWSLLVTDTEYYFYHGDQSEWRVEPALFGEARDMYGERFGSECIDTWLWHIAPQFVESDDEGEIHRVEASVRKSRNRNYR